MASPTEKPTTGTGGSIPGPGDGGLPHHHQNQNQNQNQSPPNTSHRTGLRIRDWVRSPASGETRHHHDDPTSTTSTPSVTAAAAAAAGPDSDPAPERHRAPRHDPWWKIHLFRGMVNDVRKRAPFYASDWADAWNYRVVPATVYMFFAK